MAIEFDDLNLARQDGVIEIPQPRLTLHGKVVEREPGQPDVLLRDFDATPGGTTLAHILAASTPDQLVRFLAMLDKTQLALMATSSLP